MNRDCNTSTACKVRTVCVGVCLLAGACFLLGFGSGPENSAQAQEPARAYGPPPMAWPNVTCPQPGMLPNVPVRGPRPAEGNEAGQRWQTEVDPATPPTAAFIEPLRGNDAVIQVVVGQARLLTLRADLANEQGTGVIAVADPTVVDFDIMPNPRLIRLSARRAGVTDLSITTADGEIYNFEVHVVYDLRLLEAQLRQIFPDVQLRLFQLREHLVVEGQVRSIRQADQVLRTIELYLASAQVPSSSQGQDAGASRCLARPATRRWASSGRARFRRMSKRRTEQCSLRPATGRAVFRQCPSWAAGRRAREFRIAPDHQSIASARRPPSHAAGADRGTEPHGVAEHRGGLAFRVRYRKCLGDADRRSQHDGRGCVPFGSWSSCCAPCDRIRCSRSWRSRI
jgi:hypothetical protein